MALKPIKDNQAKSPEIQTTFYQLEIPGMEEFLAKLKAKSKTTPKSIPQRDRN
jgi:hypothetical protein